jgi:DNA integrity scanning protein DisA with diadenylate cyclase activity
MTKDDLNPVTAALMQLVKQQVIRIIVKQIPLFGVPFFFSPLLSWAVGKILTVAFIQTELFIYFMKIDAMTKKEAEELTKAQDKLAQAKTEEEKKKAEEELIKAARDLIRFKP